MLQVHDHLPEGFTSAIRRAGRGMAYALLAVLAGCSVPPDSAFMNRGGPESLLDVSSEVVNLSVAGKQEVSELANWIAHDQPTRAELFCNPLAASCKEAQRILRSKNVETNLNAAPSNTVTLVYERILARDCNQRYIDNGFSTYNVLPPSVGCSLAANMVQQVSDKREFINPSLTDQPSAVGAISAYRRAYAPKPATTEAYGVTKSTVSSARNQ